MIKIPFVLRQNVAKLTAIWTLSSFNLSVTQLILNIMLINKSIVSIFAIIEKKLLIKLTIF